MKQRLTHINGSYAQAGLTFSLVLLTLFAMMACTGSKYGALLTETSDLCEVNPDSAMRNLDRMDCGHLSKYESAWRNLLYVKARYAKQHIVSDDSLIRSSYDYFVSRPDAQQYPQCMYYMGCYFSRVDSVRQAESCMLAAARTAESRKEYMTAYLAMNNLSRMLQTTDPQSAILYAKGAIRNFNHLPQNQPPSNRVALLENLGRCHMFAMQIDESVDAYDKAFAIARTINDSTFMADVLVQKGWTYVCVPSFEKALECGEEALTYSTAPSSGLCNLLFHCYGSLRQYDKAKQYLSGIDLDSNYRFYTKYLHMLGDAIVRGDKEDAFMMRDSLTYYVDRISSHNRTTSGIFIKDNMIKSMEMELAHEQHQRMVLVSVIVVLLLFIAIIIIYVWARVRQHRDLQKLQAVNADYSSALASYVSTCNDLERLKTNAEAFRSQKETEIEQLRQRLTQYADAPTISEASSEERDAIGSRLATSLHTLAARGEMATQAKLDEAVVVVEASFPSLANLLREAPVKVNERETVVCCLIRLYFSAGEIAVLLGITPQNLTNVRSRINKKLFGDSTTAKLDMRIKRCQ